MCPKCGVKMTEEEYGENVELYICPVCKNGLMTVKGELYKHLEKDAKIMNISVEEFLENSLKEL
jgi:Zn-finger nucleic acid-binding protein